LKAKLFHLKRVLLAISEGFKKTFLEKKKERKIRIKDQIKNYSLNNKKNVYLWNYISQKNNKRIEGINL